jgi:hypothetical protein
MRGISSLVAHADARRISEAKIMITDNVFI